MLILALLGALASTPAPTPAAELPPPAQEALRRATSLYTGGGAHKASFVQTYTPSGFAHPRREEGTVVIQAPQRLRFDYTSPEKKVFTYDSGEGRFYSPADAQLTVKTLSPDERARLPIVFLTSPQELAAEYAVTDAPASGGTDALELRPRAARPELAWLRLSISSDGTVTALSYEDAAGNRTAFEFGSWKSEKARPDADFKVTGPKGTRIVD